MRKKKKKLFSKTRGERRNFPFEHLGQFMMETGRSSLQRRGTLVEMLSSVIAHGESWEMLELVNSQRLKWQ